MTDRDAAMVGTLVSRAGLAPARGLTPERVAVVAVGLGGLLLGTGSLFVGAFFHDALPFVVGACAALLSLPIGRSALRRPCERAELTWRVLVYCLGAGLLNTPLSLLVVMATCTGAPPLGLDLPVVLLVATLFGSTVAAPLGLLFGALYLVPIRKAAAERAAGAVDGGERCLGTAGLWLALVGLLSLSAAALWSLSHAAARGPVLALFAGGCALVTAIGFGASLVVSVRRRRRLALVDRARSGEIDGLEVLPRAALCSEDQDLPTLGAASRAEAEALDGVLVEHRPGPDRGAYRSRDDLVPRALVRLSRDGRTNLPDRASSIVSGTSSEPPP